VHTVIADFYATLQQRIAHCIHGCGLTANGFTSAAFHARHRRGIDAR
jgi:hypothetical protein